jgi:hypothetical protein
MPSGRSSTSIPSRASRTPRALLSSKRHVSSRSTMMLSGLRRLPPPATPLAQEPPSEQQVTYTPTRRARSRARQDHAGGYREDCKPDTSAAD